MTQSNHKRIIEVIVFAFARSNLNHVPVSFCSFHKAHCKTYSKIVQCHLFLSTATQRHSERGDFSVLRLNSFTKSLIVHNYQMQQFNNCKKFIIHEGIKTF